MRRGPLYRIGAATSTQVARTKCEVCGTPTNNLWLLRDGRSVCTACRKQQPAHTTDLTQPPPAA